MARPKPYRIMAGRVIAKAYRSYKGREACRDRCALYHARFPNTARIRRKKRKCLRRCNATMRPYREKVHYISD